MGDRPIVYHKDTDLFRDALRFTAAETSFSERLIEKDYYCTVALADLAPGTGLAFKGGTCLSKVHANFCRLSEDLDFGLSTSPDARRIVRSKQIGPFKSRLTLIEERLGVLRIVDQLRGFNNSTQYGGRLAYQSVVTAQNEYIKIEISAREPIVETPVHLPVHTLLLDPFRRGSAIAELEIAVLTRREAYAEKLRAALSRRDPAIRDFFDLDQASAVSSIDAADAGLTRLLRQKLSIPGNGPVDVSPEKLDLLRAQLESQLKPVLRSKDFVRFDLDRAFARVAEFATRL